MLRYVAFLGIVAASFSSASGADAVDYLRHVKPLLAARCYACHGALKHESGLRLDTAAALRRGGESGAAIVPGASGKSLLLTRVTDPAAETRMPPESEGTPLKADEIALLRDWIEQGAAGPADEKPEADPRDHWAFRAPVRPPVPPVERSGWVRNPIDAFIAAEQERAGLTPQPPADRRLLLRRVYFDLIGLPPTADELTAFVADASDGAYEAVVDRLLASPQYGERWGRHWMDIWRYSDFWGLSSGEVRNSQKHMWHWRDWILESLDRDVGYDEMVRQMLAADELYPDDLDKLRATGFLARNYFKFNRNSWLEETIEHTSKAFLGLTLNCNRCHDHKFDPFQQVEYYRLRAFFEPYQVRTEQIAGEADFEQDGIPRVYDCHLDAPTYLFIRGDDKRPVTDEPLAPGLPKLLSFEELRIEPVSLPRQAYQPGLRPWVLRNQLAAGERQLSAARESLANAHRARAEVFAAQGETLEPTVSLGPGKPSSYESDAELLLAEKAVAAAESQLPALRARAAADRAGAEQPPPRAAAELARKASQVERRSAADKAAESLARAELELVRAAAKQQAAAETKVAAAREAVLKAITAADNPGDSYTHLEGASKAAESVLETDEARRRPFPATSTGRRAALTRWMTDRRNPLTARVAVNHIWARHMVTPLVPTVFDFGRKGTPPTHPALLDWLSLELMEHNWSMKHLHRLIVTSNTYRLTSSAAGAAANSSRDADNRYYWRMNSSRLEAQAVRDALLHLAGELDPAHGGPSLDVTKAEFSHRRSLYFMHSHNDHHRFLESFDDATVLECYRREQSIVPQQALALANSRQALDAGVHVAARIQQGLGDPTDAAFIRAAFQLVLACEPTAGELAACQQALDAWARLQPPQDGTESLRRARASLVHALLNHNDFITVR